jgi:PLP dependent protein
MGMISDNLQRLRGQIEVACTDCGRNTNEVTLLAVSKTFGADAVREAYAAGQREFGENYIQEGVDKIAQLVDLPQLVWHMVGPIQSNKTRLVAENFAWVHSIDRYKTAQRLSEQRPSHLAPLQVCLQVNIDGGANKSGVPPDELMALALQVSQLPQIQLRGMMVIPEPAINLEAAKAVFTRTYEVYSTLKSMYPNVDTLSMGMSSDMATAVQHGSTMVRIGTAVFGQRG